MRDFENLVDIPEKEIDFRNKNFHRGWLGVVGITIIGLKENAGMLRERPKSAEVDSECLN
jgi:hypothetical protein